MGDGVSHNQQANGSGEPFESAPEQHACPQQNGNAGRVGSRGCCAGFHKLACAPATTAQKVWCAVFWIAFILASGVLFAVVFPRFVTGVVTLFIALLRRELTPAQIAAVIFAAMIVLPFTIVITVIPFVWFAGLLFNFWVALGIVMAGCTIGMSLQYFLARYIFHDRVERFLQKEKRHGLAVTLRAVDLAGPWKVVTLLRLGPFPYHTLNYLLGVCPSIKYHVYIICSFICELLPRALQVFFGRSLETLADVFRGKITNVGIAVYNILVLLIGIVFVIVSVIYSKRTLRQLELEETAKEEAEAAAAAAGAADQEAALGSLQDPARSGAAADGLSLQVRSKLAAGAGELPLQMSAKLAGTAGVEAGSAAGAAAAAASPPSSCQGDLQVLVDDGSVSHSVRSGSSWIPVGRAPPAAAAIGGSSTSSIGSRLSSVSSMRRLLSGRAGASSEI